VLSIREIKANFHSFLAATNPSLPTEAACGTLERRECLSRVRRCVNLRRGSEDAQANRDTILACARENNIRPIQIAAALRAAGGKEEIFDKLDASQETIDNMRICVLQSKGLVSGASAAG